MIQSNGEYGDYRRLGVFCSLECIMERVPKLQYELGLDALEKEWEEQAV